MSLDPITDIINCSLMTSTYPTVWKMAEVIPLPEVAQNNRPISLLSCLSKICDKVVLNQYKEYLTKHKLMTRHQSGNQKIIRRRRSTLQRRICCWKQWTTSNCPLLYSWTCLKPLIVFVTTCYFKEFQI